MTLIVETGTADATAESYCSVTDATTYHAKRGNSTWAVLTNDQMEQALRKATDYMCSYFRPRWKGYHKTATQALDWPRSFVWLEPFVHGAVGTYPFLVPDTIVPTQVVTACASLALRAAAGDLTPDIERETVSEGVGNLSVSYRPGAPQYVQFREITLMLNPFTKPLGTTIERA